MDFLAVGSQEILMVLLVAILVVGPNKIVDIARTMGKIMRTIKKASFDLTSTITKELDEEEKSRTKSDKTKDQ